MDAGHRWAPGSTDTHVLYHRAYGAAAEVQPVLHSAPQDAPPTRHEAEALSARQGANDAAARALSMAWTPELEAADLNARNARAAELSLQARRITASGQL